jgi:single-stranded-DNA-specific exonuclease
VPGLDLGGAVLSARQAGLLRAGGGHAMAAGFTAEAAQLAAFHDHLEERLAAARTLPERAELVLDGALAVRGATPELVERIAALGPFGAGHEEPVVAVGAARVVKASRVGREGKTVRAFLAGEAGGRLKAICFRAGEGPLADALLHGEGRPLHLAGALRLESWNGEAGVQLLVQDAASA